jgi:hypothetical protein
MNTEAEIVQALRDYQLGRMGEIEPCAGAHLMCDRMPV